MAGAAHIEGIVSFEEFVRSVSGLITAVAMLIAAVTAFLPVWRGWEKKRDRNAVPRASSVWPFVAGLFTGAALTILTARLLVMRAPEAPATVAITQPVSGAGLKVAFDPSGSSRFDVAGSSNGVQGRRRIWVLVHPEKPVATGWWIQPDVALEPSGRWSGIGWIGSKSSQAAPGYRLLVMALVAAEREPVPVDENGVPWVRSPAVLDPVATSDAVRVVVADVK